MNDDELLRFSRHILLPDIDVSGQQKLIDSHVLIVGAGGLGSPAALYLAAAGVGHITLCDDDEVELSNLQRQIAHFDSDIGRAKVTSAAEKLKSINPTIKVSTLKQRIDEEAINRLLGNASSNETQDAVDLVVDATDNFSTRTFINRACIQSQTPAIFAAAVRLEGQLFIYDPKVADAPCYECLHEHVDDSALNCAENGVAAPVVGIIGTMEAMEALRILCQIGKSSAGFFQTFDASDMNWNRFKVLKRENCKACS